MVCDLCKKKTATLHLTEVVNDKVVETHICQACAAFKAKELQSPVSISDFLGGLSPFGGAKRKESALKCSQCGMTYTEFKKEGRVGCAQCYQTFQAHLLPLLRKIHGATHHTGKSPQRGEKPLSPKERLGELKRRLQRAIKLEEYEEAARLRDAIRNIEA